MSEPRYATIRIPPPRDPAGTRRLRIIISILTWILLAMKLFCTCIVFADARYDLSPIEIFFQCTSVASLAISSTAVILLILKWRQVHHWRWFLIWDAILSLLTSFIAGFIIALLLEEAGWRMGRSLAMLPLALALTQLSFALFLFFQLRKRPRLSAFPVDMS